MWILWAAACSCLHATSSAITKRVVERSPILASTFLSMALALPAFLFLGAAMPMPDVDWRGFVPALLGAVGVNIVTIPIRNLALRLSPLSLTVPFLAFTPLFLLGTEALIVGDRPGGQGIAGVLLIVAGAYALQLGEGTGILGPIRAIGNERGSLLMLLVAGLWSVTSVLDKVCVTRSSPVFYMCAFHLLFVAGALPLLAIARRPLLPTARREWRLLGLIALTHVGTLTAQMTAIELTLVSYVIAIKRAGMLLSVLFGALFFGERELKRRLIGAGIMSLGVALVLTG
jgi:drug/metabolite transporter (DMT)-like permease